MDLVFPDEKMRMKPKQEPQSEQEEVKGGPDLTKNILQQCEAFKQAHESYIVATEHEIDKLVGAKQGLLQIIAGLGKSKMACENDFKVSVSSVEKQTIAL